MDNAAEQIQIQVYQWFDWIQHKTHRTDSEIVTIFFLLLLLFIIILIVITPYICCCCCSYGDKQTIDSNETGTINFEDDDIVPFIDDTNPPDTSRLIQTISSSTPT